MIVTRPTLTVPQPTRFYSADRRVWAVMYRGGWTVYRKGAGIILEQLTRGQARAIVELADTL